MPQFTRRSSSRSGVVTLCGTPLVLVIMAIFLTSCSYSGEDQPSSSTDPADQVPSATSLPGWYSIYFTDPRSPTDNTWHGGPDEALVAAVDRARLSVDVAIYDFNLWGLRDALSSAHRRGVTVRMVTDSDNLDGAEIQELKDGGIPVLGDRRQGLMHNKFIVIDRLEVWTGSMNFTLNGSYRNDNNLIRIRSSQLAASYITEFEEMFVDDNFGPSSPANTPYATISLEDTLIEVYFSPEDETTGHLLELIDSAQESIHFLAFSFTADDIATAMLERAQAGVSVSGVFEESQYHSNIGTEFDHLLSAGLDVRLDGNPRSMHHKVIIIDEQIVVTGSYNFSASAETRNDENTLIIHNSEIASQYLSEFERVFSLGKR